jgi:hypothetical protein
MTKKLQYRRVLALTLLVCAVFAGLAGRLVYLQVFRHDELAKLAQDNTQREFREAPRRGDILDAHGNLLATSIPVKTVCADPSLIGTQQVAVAHALAPLLQMSEGELYPKLFVRVSKGAKRSRTICITSGSKKTSPRKTGKKFNWRWANFLRARMGKNCRGTIASRFANCGNLPFSPSRTRCACIRTARWRRRCWDFRAWRNSNWTAARCRRFPGAMALSWR